MTNNNGGPAFPIPEDASGYREYGMSLRDYFAAAALSGLMADPNVNNFRKILEIAPRQCYEIADAMLAERAK